MDLDTARSAIEKQAATRHPTSRCGPPDCRGAARRGLIRAAFHGWDGGDDKLPINKFTTHDLRRTVATQLAEMAIPLELVAAVIGHEADGRETRTLVRHYVRTDLLARKKQRWSLGSIAFWKLSKANCRPENLSI
jgi:integrase